MSEPGTSDSSPCSEPSSWQGRWGRKGLRVLLYAGLAVWATWPLATVLTRSLPVGTEHVATVPVFNAWTIWWNADRAARGYRGYWDAPIFSPTGDTFAFSEAQPTTVAVAPLVWAGTSPVAAYNVYLLVALTLNGWSAFHLLRRIGLGPLVALAGGGMVEMLPIVHWQLGVLQLVPLFGVVWTIHALYNFGEEPTVRRSLALGGAFAVTYWLCNYHGLFLSVLLILAGGWLLGRQLLRWRMWLRLVAGGLLCVALVAPIVGKQLLLSHQHDWTRPVELLNSLSAHVEDYARPPWPQLLPLPSPTGPQRRFWMLSPGYLKMLLALIGAAGGLIVARYRRWTLFCLTLTAAAFLFSLGLLFAPGGWSPYRLLMDHYPGFAQIRSVFRFGYFVHLGIALLAALGLHVLAGGLRRGVEGAASRWRTVAGWGLRVGVAAVGVAAVFEIRPAPQKLFSLPPVEINRGWLTWLAGQTEPEAVIACVPFPMGRNVEDYLNTAVWMYWQSQHHRPMVNGYSGFFPQSFLDLKEAMTSFPDQSNLDALRAQGVRYCVVQRTIVPPGMISFYEDLAQQLPRVYADDRVPIDIYELRPLDTLEH